MPEYSLDVCEKLQEKFRSAELHRPMRPGLYESGDQLSYEMSAVSDQARAKVNLTIDKFIGGGFAGQVYRIRINNIEGSPIDGLEPDKIYAMKILIPPSRLSLFFRNVVYGIGFQAPFQLQTNPQAARAGALWQKFIRRAAKIRFNRDDVVADIHATFVDSTLGSCGEISEWIEGRSWRLEVDDRMDLLKKFSRGKDVDTEKLNSPEFRAKKKFMADFVNMLHEVGGFEFARQYEWSTCKSQPNCLKRSSTGDEPTTGLTAVDFRAGLALLPFLPMSPGDFKLIFNGLCRASLVQFDRGSIKRLEQFTHNHPDEFADMHGMLDQLKQAEDIYRNSIPDITHNHVKLLYSRKLWSTIFDRAVTGFATRNFLDEKTEKKLRSNKISTLLFSLLGLIPFLGRFVRRIWARPDWRRHYTAKLTSWDYLNRSIQGRIAEKVIAWHKAGRVTAENALKVAESPWRFFVHLPLSILFVWMHRSLTDPKYAKERLAYVFLRPMKLYFNSDLREQWLRDMVTQGKKKHILSDEDALTILAQIKEPFIQKYLKSLAVHVCTLPITQIVSVMIAIIYYFQHPDDPNAWKKGLGIVALFQVIPISPGSICRGLYVVYMVIKDRNFKDYNIAVFLGFFKYVGYLAFPIQMTYHYPALARFMAGHWATEAVHIVPVFGERGALLEHWVFCLFYNWPLTVRRRMRKRAELRSTLKPRYRHAAIYALIAAAIFAITEFIYQRTTTQMPNLKDIWYLSLFLPFACGSLITLGCGGTKLPYRIITTALAAIAIASLYTAFSAILIAACDIPDTNIFADWVWRTFIFTIFSAIGTIITELKLPEPDLA